MVALLRLEGILEGVKSTPGRLALEPFELLFCRFSAGEGVVQVDQDL
ncbi:hypothetical protein HBO32_09805 [Pseudomonas nitroreducens]|nr:hypothetical protein [Pseudomonas nitroreducens]NMZ73392.1 hypothetical protein [Pseudomonas nitroreducens]